MEFNPPRKMTLGRTNVCSDAMADELVRDINGIVHSIKYINRTGRDVQVRDRLGFVQTVLGIRNRHRTPVFGNTGFYILYTVNFDECDYMQAMDYYRRLSNESEVYRSAFEELEFRRKQGRDKGPQELELAIHLRDSDFFEKLPNGQPRVESPIYLEEFGISLGFADSQRELITPGSVEDVIKYRNNATSLALKDSLNDSALISIEAVDNSGGHTYSKLYISLCNQIMEVPIRYDSNASSHGIVIKSHPTLDMLNSDPKLKRTDIITRVVSFEEAFESLGVALSVEDAATRGDSKRAIEREVANRQLEIRRLELELAETARKNRLEDEARKREQQELDMQRLEVRRQQEELDYKRKKEIERAAEERQRLKEERADLESRLNHKRSIEKMERETKRDDTRGFWNSVADGMKYFGIFVSVASMFSAAFK